MAKLHLSDAKSSLDTSGVEGDRWLVFTPYHATEWKEGICIGGGPTWGRMNVFDRAGLKPNTVHLLDTTRESLA